MWKAFLRWFRAGLADILDAIEPLAKQIADSGGKLLLQIAFEAVIAAEQAGGSGQDKFNAAQKAVISGLKARGLPIVLNAINGSIEIAVARMKEK